MGGLILALALILAPSSSTVRAAPLDDFARSLLDADEAQWELWEQCQDAGVLEIAPVNLPADIPGDCNHLGWPIASMAADGAIVVMHRRIPGHKRQGAGDPDPSMSYGIVLRSADGGQTWSEPYDMRDSMTPENRTRGGLVPFSHRYKFDPTNESRLGYKIHLHAIGTARDGAIIAINNHGVFRSDDAGLTWKHFPTALRDDTFRHPMVNLGPRILDVEGTGLVAFGNWFGQGGTKQPPMSTHFVALTSPDGGESWAVEDHDIGFSQYEPAAIHHGDRFLLVTRDQDSKRSHRHLAWTPGSGPEITETNLKDPRLVDTVDLSFNPVTKRFEVIRSERHHMELWLWSLAPEDWSTGQWKRECRLLRRGGQFYKTADGFHPAGAVIDARRGVQHIFIYAGHPNGPAGIFRITRTLRTPDLSAVLGAPAPRP